MALVPDSLTPTVHQQWAPGNPPQPAGVRADLWAVTDAGDVVHKFFDPTTGAWSGWENLSQP